ncbi:hypothetical protein HPB49_018324 [Dermacentor silvarum]|uniref:Uncharacterized protein n=1 Tax=Dermacentor silvarum TaxID=543639 RepID=A0ACB8DF51_DERSI|nr:serine-rich adhesin for platelets [Dermacentor silvarum]KAH7966656.1 hypothetical protein HPB49_018324 [Dermacentor silvarum]
MYYASFFPPAVRPFDGRGPLDGVTAAAAAAALAGSAGVRGERGEIPLDLSLKHVRPDGPEAAAAEELLLLEHRKLAAAYGRHLLDPAAFLRLQHYQQRVAADAFLQQAFGSAAAAQHHAMAAARLGCLDQQVAFHSTARAAAPSTAAFLEPAAALALSMRGAGAPALAPGDLARSLYPPTAATALPAGYSSMFADMMPKPDPCRLADDAKAGSYPRANGVSASAADKASSSSSYIADPVRYAAEHMHRLQESQTSAKFASTSGSAQTTSTSSTSSSSSSREHKKSSSNRHTTDTSTSSTSSASSSTAASNAAAAAAAAAALNLLGPRPSLGGGLSSAFGETVKREDYLNAAAHLPFYPGWGLPPLIPPPTTTPLLTTPSPQKKKDSSSRSSDRSSSESRNNSRSSSSHHGKSSSSKRSSSSFSSNNVDHHQQHHQHISDVVVIDEEQRSRLTSSLRLGSSSGGRPPPPPEPERAKMPRLEAMQPPDEAKTSHAGSNDGGKRPAVKSPLSPPPLIAAVPPATSPKTAEPSAAPGALLLGKPTLPAASTTSATAASLHGKHSNHHHSKLTTPHDEKPTLNFFFRDHKAAATAAPSSVASVPRTTAADVIAQAHQAHLQYLQQLHSSNGGHVLPPSSALAAMEAPSAFGVTSPVKEESPRSAHHHHHHLPATASMTASTVTPCKDATAAHAKSSPPPQDRVKEPRTVEATTVRIQKENGGVRYSIHPKKRKLDSDEQSPPATPPSVLAASSAPASSCEENDALSSRASRSPERIVESASRRRPQSHSADSVLSSLRPELRQRRMQYHAVRRRKLRSGLDMIRRRKRTSTTAAAKLAGRSDRKPFGELNYSAPPDLSKIPLNKSTGETVLHRAARLGHVDLAWCCLESREGGSVESCDVNGQTPLHEAASRGHLRVGRALLQCGADPNACAHNGRRPLHDAVEKGHVEMVRLLLSYGADAMLTTGSGLSPLELARSPIMVELLRGFLSDMAGESIDGSPVLPWHFPGTASLMDPKDTGFDVLAGAPAEDSGDDMLFQASESAQIATYRLGPHLAGTSEQSCSECVRLDDVLQRLRISAEEFRQRFPAVEVLVLPAHELRAKTTTPWLDAEAVANPLESSGAPAASSSSPPSPPQPVAAVPALRFDATVRSILGLHNPIPR